MTLRLIARAAAVGGLVTMMSGVASGWRSTAIGGAALLIFCALAPFGARRPLDRPLPTALTDRITEPVIPPEPPAAGGLPAGTRAGAPHEALLKPLPQINA